jgi:uncharacterized membrane protein
MSKDKGKTIAIVSYITWIGLLVAFLMNSDKKDKFASFHIRQSLLIMLAALVVGWIPLIGWLIAIALFVFWIMGLVAAIQGKEKKVPVIGDWAQNWFKSL